MPRIDIDKISRLLPTQNTEVTDPGIRLSDFSKDEYIPPQANNSRASNLSPTVWGPVRWVQSLLAKKRVREEASELIAKIERLPLAPDTAIRYFFDNDLPRLVFLSRLQPIIVQQILKEREAENPWFRLVQIACGDSKAFVSALDGLC